ncbi:aminotransferase class V-fold PLP-dependent enzyme [Microvirga lenta]|uniref:aminotransferase class V-fold PLP-dependent enzyme n=1 Tax=Microvirga lenta TaxID=2881337 RepID=UPI001CFFD062|nr:aminotransferase class V-fold PLP-dependent enzyme [Microvirga lenta]MCB5175816.1 aminotransferase class V-fold PLP-dependent enzyme [Microvirga lenta]
MLDLRAHFSRFLNTEPGRLHFAAHSHHPWPDVTRDAHLQAWDDAARLMDDKWEHVLGPVLEEFRSHVARNLSLPDSTTLAVAPNTHEFLKRILSCFPAGRSIRILTSDSEFHSFSRQIARLEEDGDVLVTRVPVEPLASFEDRFEQAAAAGHDLVFVSQVFFSSGFVADIERIAEIAGDAMLVIDGYHGFMARPTDLSGLANRAFYVAGGYKYAMAGEGACFMHCPPGWGARPSDTGWFAAFGDLSKAQGGQVAYSEDGWRFMGATFDPSGLYRFNAVMRWLVGASMTAEAIHDHVTALQQDLVRQAAHCAGFDPSSLVVPVRESRRGNFLTFERPDAQAVYDRLKAQRVVTDVRGNRLRLGFGIYQTPEDVTELVRRIHQADAFRKSSIGAPVSA